MGYGGGRKDAGDALDYVSRIVNKIILVDGARLMFDHGIGVSTASVYEVKRLDSDCFADA